MSRVLGLKCKECGERYPATPKLACDKCWGPLEVEYDEDILSKIADKRALRRRPFNLWRYSELLPLEDPRKAVDMGDGGTPLIHCQRLGERLGAKDLYIKDDTANPTLSFKDRPASIGVSKCIEFGISTVGCASTGNLAGAVAAHASKAGLKCVVLVPADIEENKIVQTANFGARIIAVRGTYDDSNRLGVLAAERLGWGMANINIRPFYVEGSKTIAYEVCEQLGWKTPDVVVVPVASGGLLCAAHRGFKQLESLDWVPEYKTRLVASQPQGCSPIVQAFKEKADLSPVERPSTLVKSLAIGSPASGYETIRAIEETKGTADAPSDEETLEAIKLLAKHEGIFAEPAGAISLASYIRLRQAGEIDPDERVVLLVTGSGFKAQETASQIVERPVQIEPTTEALLKATET